MRKFYFFLITVIILFANHPASANVHYYHPVDIAYPNGGSLLLDVNHDSNVDFYFDVTGTTYFTYIISPSTAHTAIYLKDGSGYPQAYSSGASYSSNTNWSFYDGNLGHNFGTTSKYLVVNVSGGGHVYSGWVKIYTEYTSTGRLFIDSYAYSDIDGYDLKPGATTDVTAIEATDNNVSVLLSPGCIQIEGLTGICHADIFNLSGQLINNINITEGKQNDLPIALNPMNLYIVSLRKENVVVMSKMMKPVF